MVRFQSCIQYKEQVLLENLQVWIQKNNLKKILNYLRRYLPISQLLLIRLKKTIGWQVLKSLNNFQSNKMIKELWVFLSFREKLWKTVFFVFKDESKQMEHINIERFYDYDTNSYLMKFKSPEALDSMKKMH
jgi:hypothetical protein